MRDGFEFLARDTVGENNFGEDFTIQPPIRCEDFIAKSVLDFLPCRLARLDDLAGEGVRVYHRHAPFVENFFSGGFAHADAAGQSEHFHAASNHFKIKNAK